MYLNPFRAKVSFFSIVCFPSVKLFLYLQFFIFTYKADYTNNKYNVAMSQRYTMPHYETSQG